MDGKPPLRIGVAGLGTVGGGVLRLLDCHAEQIAARCGRRIVITGVSARERGKDRGLDLGEAEWFDDPVALAQSPGIDAFVELIGGEGGVAKAAVEAALKAGKPVVTANKALLAHHGVALAKLAEASGVALNFEAAVAGGLPVVKFMRESLSGNEVVRVYGILNGTTNYILSRMTNEGGAFGDILKEAQRAGFAEADPAFDIGGFDAAHKLAILTSLAFGTHVSLDTIYIEGIEGVTAADIEAADELGYRIKLLGVALKTDSGIEQRVHPAMVPKQSAIAEVDGVTNCVAIDGDFIGDVLLVGAGAGRGRRRRSWPIWWTCARPVAPVFGVATRHLKPYQRAQMRAHEGGYYIRLSVYDRLGAFAAISGRMAEQGISLESIVQRRPPHAASKMPRDGGGTPTPVVMITHPTLEASIRAALEAIERDGHVESPAADDPN
jgi:homoserine dehydrogenase